MSDQLKGFINGKEEKDPCAFSHPEKYGPLNMDVITLPVSRNGFICTGHYTPTKTLCVIDLDAADAQKVDFHKLTNIPLLQKNNTFITETGGDGAHLYYWVLTKELITNHAYKLNGTIGLTPLAKDLHIKEVDTRGEGGLVFAPGCKFKEHSHEYLILIDQNIKEISLATYNSILKLFVNLPKGEQQKLF